MFFFVSTRPQHEAEKIKLEIHQISRTEDTIPSASKELCSDHKKDLCEPMLPNEVRYMFHVETAGVSTSEVTVLRDAQKQRTFHHALSNVRGNEDEMATPPLGTFLLFSNQ
jgi:hypothetical protein